MKTLIFALCCLTTLSAMAFETGKYSGESTDGSQYCELDIVQHEKSYSINVLNCENAEAGRSLESQPKEFFYGKTKQYFQESKMTMTTEAAANKFKMKYSNKDGSNSYDKELTAKDSQTVHFSFLITQEGEFSQWFDVDLKKE